MNYIYLTKKQVSKKTKVKLSIKQRPSVKQQFYSVRLIGVGNKINTVRKASPNHMHIIPFLHKGMAHFAHPLVARKVITNGKDYTHSAKLDVSTLPRQEIDKFVNCPL